MKKVYYLLAVLTSLFFVGGCTETEHFGGEGTLRMKVKVYPYVDVATTRSLTDAEQAELENNCEIRIYSGKGLIRYYKGISQMPEELQLVSGGYNVRVNAGDSVPASFDKIYYKGVAPFEITKGNITTQEVKCKIANVLANVNFGESTDELFESYKMTISTKFGSLEFTNENKGAIGYYMLSEEENTFQWKFDGTLKNGKLFEKSGIVDAEPATRYDLSLNFTTDDYEDGGAVLKVSVDVTPLETIEDEVEFKQRPSFRGVGYDIKSPYIYALGATNELAYKIAVTSALTDATLSCDKLMEWGFDTNNLQLVNISEEEKAALAEKGLRLISAFDEVTGAGILTVTLSSELIQKLTTNETSYALALTAIDALGKSNSTTLSIVVSDAAVLTKDVNVVDVWTSKATLRGELIYETTETLSFNYKVKGTSEWNNVAAVKEGETKNLSAQLTGLLPGTAYEYQALAGNTPSAVICTFSTEAAAQLPNGGFENWSGSTPLLIYGEGEKMFWDSGNKGSAKMSKNVTTHIDRAGLNGGKRAAQLQSQFVGVAGFIGKFAAGNLFTGEFLGTEDTTQGILSFGREFTSRPSELSIYYRATLGNITHSETSMAPEGVQDTAIVYIALTDWDAPIEVHTKDKSTLFSKNDPHIIAYGELLIDKNVNDWTNHKIKLEYREKSKTTKPKYILVVASASKYGDYYTGSTSSTLWLDDFELIYE